MAAKKKMPKTCGTRTVRKLEEQLKRARASARRARADAKKDNETFKQVLEQNEELIHDLQQTKAILVVAEHNHKTAARSVERLRLQSEAKTMQVSELENRLRATEAMVGRLLMQVATNKSQVDLSIHPVHIQRYIEMIRPRDEPNPLMGKDQEPKHVNCRNEEPKKE